MDALIYEDVGKILSKEDTLLLIPHSARASGVYTGVPQAYLLVLTTKDTEGRPGGWENDIQNRSAGEQG